ncbi:MAG: hypothetical protein EP330_14115 [Deltaproteobacteria bacterium]|nr:MAG: hypothetical protein EP330_14115 [Deltaproteobacteria bacterium]
MLRAAPVLVGGSLALLGALLMGLALDGSLPDGAPTGLWLLAGLCALPAGLTAVAGAHRLVPWPIAVLLHVGTNPAFFLLALGLVMTFAGMVLWFLIPGIGMAGAVVLMASPEVALSGLVYALLGALGIAAGRRVHELAAGLH